MAWFESGLTDSFPRRYAPLTCLGWLDGSFCPHFDSEPKRQPVLKRLIASGTLQPGYAVEDNVALHFVDGRLARAVSSRRGARAFRVGQKGSKYSQSEIRPDPL
jgi:dipeptidase E